eukprot:5937689-Alexandrium_andersonii.AAC.1
MAGERRCEYTLARSPTQHVCMRARVYERCVSYVFSQRGMCGHDPMHVVSPSPSRDELRLRNGCWFQPAGRRM